MEMHQLRYVVAVARTGNFSRAAEQCRVSQPSLSQQIQKLEDELGERLFDRMKREKLTPRGKLSAPRRPILEEAEMACAKPQRPGACPGTSPSASCPPSRLIFCRRRWEICGNIPASKSLFRKIPRRSCSTRATYEIDFAFASRPFMTAAGSQRIVYRGTAAGAAAGSSPDPQTHRPMPTSRTAHRHAGGHCLGDQVLGFCEQRDMKPTISFRSAQLETIQALVGPAWASRSSPPWPRSAGGNPGGRQSIAR